MFEKLLNIFFQQSEIDECVFYKGDIIFIVYIDNGIFWGNNNKKLTNIIWEIKSSGLDVDDQGHPAEYIGVNINQTKDGYYQFSQRSLMENMIDDANFSDFQICTVKINIYVTCI